MKVLVCVVDTDDVFFTPTFEHVVLETPEIVVSQPELGYHGEIRERAALYLRDEVAMETDEGQGRHAPKVGVADDLQVVVVEVDPHGASRDVSRDLEYIKQESLLAYEQKPSIRNKTHDIVIHNIEKSHNILSFTMYYE